MKSQDRTRTALALFCLLGAMGLDLSKAAAKKPSKPAPVVVENKTLSPELETRLEQEAKLLRDAGLKSNFAYEWLTELTTRFGPRPAGSESEAKAAQWAQDYLQAEGFSNVRQDRFDLVVWKRGAESVKITAPFAQNLVGTALGGSQPTPEGGIEAEAVVFETYAAFAASKADLNNKIVVILQPTARTQNGIGYGMNSGLIRRKAPLEARSRGAVGYVMRSLGTEDHRFAHAGATQFQEKEGIASFAISVPDAEAIGRMTKMITPQTGPLKLKLVSHSSVQTSGASQNVIAELKGKTFPNEIITIGGHLDSWDLGTGAIDDGAGVAITLAAIKLMKDQGLVPDRTIRLVMYGSEEVSQPGGKGLSGANAYAQTYVNKAKLGLNSETHILTAESDFGADYIYALQLSKSQNPKAVALMARLLAPMKIYLDPNPAQDGGPDTTPSVALGVPVMDLAQNGMDYFDVHHTADDTIERVKPEALKQNVAAWASVLWIIANSDMGFESVKSAK